MGTKLANIGNIVGQKLFLVFLYGVMIFIFCALSAQLFFLYLEFTNQHEKILNIVNQLTWKFDGRFKNHPSSIWYEQSNKISIGAITNKVKIGVLAGNRNLEFGVKNVIEEVLQDKDYSIDPSATLQITADIVYLDVLKNSSQLSVFHKEKESVVIRLFGTIVKDGKVIKKAIAEESADETSMSTLLIDEGGKFNQTNLSSALKKASNSLVNKLL
jgi:hypothetical protein